MKLVIREKSLKFWFHLLHQKLSGWDVITHGKSVAWVVYGHHLNLNYGLKIMNLPSWQFDVGFWWFIGYFRSQLLFHWAIHCRFTMSKWKQMGDPSLDRVTLIISYFGKLKSCKRIYTSMTELDRVTARLNWAAVTQWTQSAQEKTKAWRWL